LFFVVSLFIAGYTFAAGAGDFPEAFVAAFDADSGIAQIGIDWKKVQASDERQFGLYRSTGKQANVYELVSALNPMMTVHTDSGLATDTEYHYIIGGALPHKTLALTRERGAKEQRAEMSMPKATISYGQLPAGPIAWIPSEQPAPAQSGSYQQQSVPAQSGNYQQQSVPSQGGSYPQSVPAQSGSYQQQLTPAQGGSYQQQLTPSQSGSYQQQSVPSPGGSYQQQLTPAQGGSYQQQSVPSQSGSYPQSVPSQSGNYQQQLVPSQGGSYQPQLTPSQSGSYQQQSVPSQSGSYPQSVPSQGGSYPQSVPSQGGSYQQQSVPSQGGSYQQQLTLAQGGGAQSSPVQTGNGQAAQTQAARPTFPYHEPVGNFRIPERDAVFENGGIFFSMGYFSNRVSELTGAMDKPTAVSLMDSNAKSRLLSLFRQTYMRSTLPGTSFYYAIHNAINRMSNWDVNGTLSDFDTCLLVTITDGLDTSSVDPALAPIDGFSFKTTSAYQDFIKKSIESKRVGGKKITAFSIGIRGTDTIVEREYEATLRAAASSENNVYRIPLRSLTKTLQDIAASVTKTQPTRPFGFVTPVYPDGTEIFIALDTFSTPARGQNFVAGRIRVVGSQLYLENITLGGLAKETPAAIPGRVVGRVESGGNVEWRFEFLEELNPAKFVMYYKIDKNWQGTKEFAVRTYPLIESRHSVLVYLLVDNSGSMSDQNIAAIRDSTTKFIDALSVNYAGVQPKVTGGTALVMTPIPERSSVVEMAARNPLVESQETRPPIPETGYDQEARFVPVNESASTSSTVSAIPVRDPDVSKTPVPVFSPPSVPFVPVAPPAYSASTAPTASTAPIASPTPPVPSIPKPVSGSNGYWVQTSSSEARSIAEGITAQLRQYQLSPVITETRVQGKTFYRVRVGPYASLADASTVAEFVKQPPLGFYDSFIP
jgi:cell division septation protein DedD